MTDIDEVKRNLSRRGLRPALDANGEPFLTRTTVPGITFISADQLINELAKRGKTINVETLVITDAIEEAIEKPKDVVKAPKEPSPKKKAPKAKPKVEVWTRKELEEMNYNELRKLASEWPGVHGNKGKEHILEGLTGKPKAGPGK